LDEIQNCFVIQGDVVTVPPDKRTLFDEFRKSGKELEGWKELPTPYTPRSKRP
jgi:hypothetical protein